MSWTLNTAAMPDRGLREAIERNKPGFVAVSLDGPKAVHDAFRGRAGAWDEAMEAIRFFKSLGGVRVCAGTTVTSRNYDYLDETFHLVDDQRGRSVGDSSARARGPGGGPAGPVPLEDAAQEAHPVRRPQAAALPRPDGRRDRLPGLPRTAGSRRPADTAGPAGRSASSCPTARSCPARRWIAPAAQATSTIARSRRSGPRASRTCERGGRAASAAAANTRSPAKAAAGSSARPARNASKRSGTCRER